MTADSRGMVHFWLLEAFIELAGSRPYKSITIMGLADRAGVPRQRFYRHYRTKDDIPMNLLDLSIIAGVNSIGLESADGGPRVVITLDYEFHRKNQRYFKKMLEDGFIRDCMERRVEEKVTGALKDYQEKLPPKERLACRYRFYHQTAGCINVVHKWLQEDMPVSKEALASLIKTELQPRDHSGKFPGLELRMR